MTKHLAKIYFLIIPLFGADPQYSEAAGSPVSSAYDLHPALHDHTTEHGPFEAASDRECLELSRLVLFDLDLIAR
jgi:hypothetical protein